MATLITLERLNLSLKNVQNSLAALMAKMPTKVSQLVNDSNYMTTETTNKLIEIETVRAQEAEQLNADNIIIVQNNLTDKIEQIEADIETNINTKITDISSNLDAESTRAIAAEQANADAITAINTQLDGVADALAAI